MFQNAQSQIIVIDGVRLKIVTEEVGENEWQLAVKNDLGISSIWYELFPTRESAVEAARKAIESEGVEAFVDTEGFEYLLH